MHRDHFIVDVDGDQMDGDRTCFEVPLRLSGFPVRDHQIDPPQEIEYCLMREDMEYVR